MIFFSPEADGPKKCIVRLYLDSFGRHSLLEENAWDVVAFSFSETKDFWLFLWWDLQVEFGANHKTEEEVKSSLLIPYSPLHSKGSIPCSKLGQRKKKKKGGFESSCSPSHADCCSLEARTHLPSSGAILNLLIHPKGEQLQEQRLKEAYRRIASSRAINTLAGEVGDPHSVPASWLVKITRSLASLPSLRLSCKCPDPWAWL